jgi:meso-butanediol dehydrogenase / (S,S)-butanediol dehydrogenase / diacetyl reductase
MDWSSRFKGKVVLVTGASQGIGEAIALRFANEGANLVLCANEERIFDVADRARQSGSQVLVSIMDVSKKAEVVSLFESIKAEFGGLDVSIHNAGIIKIAPISELTEEDWDQVLDINCKGVFLCCQSAAQLMIPQHHGRIINAASGQSRQARPFTPHYAASKAGVVGITQSLALELAPYAITVNAYCPGVINTEMWKYNDREWGRLFGGYGPGDFYKETVGRIPLGRPGTPQDVAGLVTFLASEDASFITGQAIYVNGGSIMAS